MKKNLKKYLSLFFTLLILIISVGIVSASPDSLNANETVLSEAPSEVTVNGNNFVDIQDSVNNAAENATVKLEGKNYYPDKQELESDIRININKSINLVGVKDQTVIDANDGKGIIKIENADNVLIKNIIFTKTSADGESAVIATDSNIIFENCIFEDNQGNIGSAININSINRDVEIKIINSTFKYNIADADEAGGVGGAIAIFSDVDRVAKTTISNSLFTLNSAKRGSAIYASASGEKTNYLKVSNTVFNANSNIRPVVGLEEITGADIHIWDSPTYEVEIINSSFENEKYPREGKGEEEVSENSLVLSNYKNKIINSTFKNSTVYFVNTTATIENCQMIESGINAYYNVYDDEEIPDANQINLIINNSVIKKTFIELGSGLIKNSQFINAFVDKDSDKDLTVDSCSFEDESYLITSAKTDVLNTKFTNYSTLNSFSSVDLLVDGCEFTNAISLMGSAILLNGDGEEIPSKSKLTITNTIFINNTARYFGGAISIMTDADAEILNCEFINNSARVGGAVFAAIAKVNITNSSFIGNLAQNNDEVTYAFLSKNELDISSEYAFLMFDELFALDIVNWDDNEYNFPEYTFGMEIFNGSYVKTDYFGSAVFGVNITVENNYWGTQIDSADDLVNYRIINKEIKLPSTWINKNTTVKKVAVINITENGKYYGHKTVTITLLDNETKTPIKNQEIYVTASYALYEQLFTDDEGKAVYNLINDAGVVNILATAEIDGYKFAKSILTGVKISKLPLTGKTAKLTTVYDSAKGLTITVYDKTTGKSIKDVFVAVKVFTGKKSKTYMVQTNSKGVATFKPLAKVTVGSHKVEITSGDTNYALSKIKTTIKITKAKTTVKAPKVTNKYKKSKYFKVTVKHKTTKKVVKSVKVKVKVYTGKKYKTYTLKTNKKGVAQLNTKSLKVGKHKVVISSGNTNYQISAKSTIVIKK